MNNKANPRPNTEVERSFRWRRYILTYWRRHANLFTDSLLKWPLQFVWKFMSREECGSKNKKNNYFTARGDYEILRFGIKKLNHTKYSILWKICHSNWCHMEQNYFHICSICIMCLSALPKVRRNVDKHSTSPYSKAHIHGTYHQIYYLLML